MCESANATFLSVSLSATNKHLDVILAPSASDGLQPTENIKKKKKKRAYHASKPQAIIIHICTKLSFIFNTNCFTILIVLYIKC